MVPRLAALLLALFLPAAPAPGAETVPGAAEPPFVAAVEAWLADDEAAALPVLSDLAEDGNTAAQMLLALIDKTPSLQGAWLTNRPREERAALMRAPGGLSGRSWMHAAAETTPLAGLWTALWQVDTPVSVALDFAAAGETRAARETLLALAARGREGFAEAADDPHYPPAMRYLVWREWAAAPAGDEAALRRAREIAALSPAHPQRAMIGHPPDPASAAQWLRENRDVFPAIAAFCDANCGAAAGNCAQAAYEAFASYPMLATFGSPSATLIDPLRFAESPRGQGALLRRLLLTVDARGRRSLIERAEETSACFAEALRSEAQHYTGNAMPPPQE